MANTYYISASYIGAGLGTGSYNLFHTECGRETNLIEYSGSTIITSASLAEGLVLELDSSITSLYLVPISLDCPLGCGYEYSITLSIPATPTATPTNTPTATPTATPSGTPEATPTDTPEATPTETPSNTPTNTIPGATPTSTPTPTQTPSNTPSNTPTQTPPNTPTQTPSNTPTQTPSNTPSNTPTATPTATPIPCYEYEIQNFSVNQPLYYGYTTCEGILRNDGYLPPGETATFVCMQENSFRYLGGSLSYDVSITAPCDGFN